MLHLAAAHRIAHETPLLARIAELEVALARIAADAYVGIDDCPDHDQPNGWRTLACARIDIARAALKDHKP